MDVGRQVVRHSPVGIGEARAAVDVLAERDGRRFVDLDPAAARVGERQDLAPNFASNFCALA